MNDTAERLHEPGEPLHPFVSPGSGECRTEYETDRRITWI